MSLYRFGNGNVVVDGLIWQGAEIHVADGRVAALSPLRGTAGGTIDLDGGWLMPGFVDTQVNGGGGTLFNDDPSVDGIARIAAAHAAFGTTAFLPTLISDRPDRIAQALAASDAAIAAGIAGVVGIHIEGPCLSPRRKGIHDAAHFRRLDAEMVALLTRPHRGVVMVTLAPECADAGAIAALVAAGVRVSAGHTDLGYAEARAAFGAGVTGVTHLFNAMPPLHHREPGIAGAALDDPRPWCGLIVDGVHVPPAMLRIAIRARGPERMMLVTDAMPSVGAIEKDFVLQGRQIRVADGKALYDDGTLAGADLDMASAVANSVGMLGLNGETASALASTNPAAFLGLDRERGTLAPGFRADWVQLDRDFKPCGTWIDGRRAA